MTTNLRQAFIPACLLVLGLSGCAQQGPMLSRQTTLGSLKAGVSHLEFENQQLRRQVADLKAENRQVEDRLVQEEAANGELSARLDDARNVISRRPPSDLGTETADLGPPPSGSRKTLPAGRTNKPGRKPPFARIPARIDTLPPAGSEESGEEPAWRPGWNGDPGPQSMRDDTRVWLPVARTPSDASPARR